MLSTGSGPSVLDAQAFISLHPACEVFNKRYWSKQCRKALARRSKPMPDRPLHSLCRAQRRLVKTKTVRWYTQRLLIRLSSACSKASPERPTHHLLAEPAAATFSPIDPAEKLTCAHRQQTHPVASLGRAAPSQVGVAHRLGSSESDETAEATPALPARVPDATSPTPAASSDSEDDCLVVAHRTAAPVPAPRRALALPSDACSALPVKSSASPFLALSRSTFFSSSTGQRPPSALAAGTLLSQSESARVERAFRISQGNPAAQLVTRPGADINGCSFLTLRGNQWLQSGVINPYLHLLQDRQRRSPGAPKIHLFHTFFFSKLTERVSRTKSHSRSPNSVAQLADINYEAVRRWTAKSQPVATCDALLIPINSHDSHWTCILVSLSAQQIIYFDSFLGWSSSKTRQMLQVWSWLMHEVTDKKCSERVFVPADAARKAASGRGGKSGRQWTMHVADGVPAQHDGCSCGVFMLGAVDMLAQGLLPPYAFSQASIAKMRIGVATQLLRGHVS